MLTFYGLVALGGALGSVLRAGCVAAGTRLTGPGFPWGTVTVNVAGSFLIGALAVLLGPGLRASWAGDARAFLIIGMCGGFTTFSSFSLQTMELVREGRVAAASANVIASVTICLLATGIGMAAATSIKA